MATHHLKPFFVDTFELDLNGAQTPHKGIRKVPIVDERLFLEIESNVLKVYPLNEKEKEANKIIMTGISI